MGWPPLSCGGDTSQAQWSQPNTGNARASEQSWAWLVHKFGDFQATEDILYDVLYVLVQAALVHSVSVHDEACGCHLNLQTPQVRTEENK